MQQLKELSGMESAAWEPKKVGYKVRPASKSDNLQVLRCPCPSYCHLRSDVSLYHPLASRHRTPMTHHLYRLFLENLGPLSQLRTRITLCGGRLQSFCMMIYCIA